MADLRPVSQKDVDAVCAFLDANMHRGMTKDQYRSLFTYPWMSSKPGMGYLLEQEGEVVGFLGAIYSERAIQGRTELFCNLTNWCVLPTFRNESLRLLFAVHARSRQTIVNLSPSEDVQKMLDVLRYRRLDTFKLFSFPLLQCWTLAGGAKLVWRDSEIESYLDQAERKLVGDHRGTGCRFTVIVQDGEACLLVSKKRCKRRLAFTEILHVSSPLLLRKNFERVKLGLLLRDRSLWLAIDERLLHARLSLMLPYRRVSFIKSSCTEPQDVDNLYSELAIL
jgi:acetoacetyl-CoA synthetase